MISNGLPHKNNPHFQGSYYAQKPNPETKRGPLIAEIKAELKNTHGVKFFRAHKTKQGIYFICSHSLNQALINIFKRLEMPFYEVSDNKLYFNKKNQSYIKHQIQNALDHDILSHQVATTFSFRKKPKKAPKNKA